MKKFIVILIALATISTANAAANYHQSSRQLKREIRKVVGGDKEMKKVKKEFKKVERQIKKTKSAI